MSWCHRLIAHDWLLSVCRPHPATSSTFVFNRFYCASRAITLSLLSHNTRYSLSSALSLSFSLFFSLIVSSYFFSVLFMATRDIHSRLVPFVLESMPQLTSEGEKKIGRETVSTYRGRERQQSLTDLLRRPRTDTSHAAFLFFAFRSQLGSPVPNHALQT